MAKKHHVSEQTLFVWRKRVVTMSPLDTKRLKQLEAEVLKEISASEW